MASKKRHHPDELHLSSSFPKRLLAVTDADMNSNHRAVSSVCSLNSPDGSMWNTASSALINSDLSTSIHCSENSNISGITACYKLGNVGFTNPRLSADASSYVLSKRDTAHEDKGKGKWFCGSHEAGSEIEASEVTFEKRVRGLSSVHELAAIKRSLGRDENWVSMACEVGPYRTTEESVVKEKRSKHGFVHVSESACTNSSMASSAINTKAKFSAGSKAQEEIGCTDNHSLQRHSNHETFSIPSNNNKTVMEEHGPSYVLSSGRLSLEEEARLGHRAPTIDHDFEEYFSSLML